MIDWDESLPVTESFGKNGFVLKLVRRHNRVAIYELFKEGVSKGFEVHKSRISPACILPRGTVVARRTKHPCNEDFGKYGWSFENKMSADKKFEELSAIKKINS